jgi:hypothetical protein
VGLSGVGELLEGYTRPSVEGSVHKCDGGIGREGEEEIRRLGHSPGSRVLSI